MTAICDGDPYDVNIYQVLSKCLQTEGRVMFPLTPPCQRDWALSTALLTWLVLLLGLGADGASVLLFVCRRRLLFVESKTVQIENTHFKSVFK